MVQEVSIFQTFKLECKKTNRFIIDKLGFETSQGRERTFNIYDKLDDIHANGLHDYLKYLKFGYGRCTDDASTEIRYGRMSRYEAIKYVSKFDHVEPSDLKIFLKKAKCQKRIFNIVDKHRDKSIWEQKGGKWFRKDHVKNHLNENDKQKNKLDNEKHFIKTKEKVSPHSQKTSKQTEYVII